MADYFLCLDSCVLRDVFDEFRDGEQEPETWVEFKKLIDEKHATLLVPEIVLLEFDRGGREIEDGLKSEIPVVLKSITDKTLKERLHQSMKGWLGESQHKLAEQAKTFVEWLKPHSLEYTEAIAHATKKRGIARNFPVTVDPTLEKSERDKNKSQQNERLRDQDCAIIETLIAHFGGKIDDRILAFATTDRGFGPIREDGLGNFDWTFRNGLPQTQVFNDLKKLTEFVKSKGTVSFLSKEELERIRQEEAQVEALRQQAIELQLLLKNTAGLQLIQQFTDPQAQLPLFEWAEQERQRLRNRRAHTERIIRADEARRKRNQRGNTMPPPSEPPKP